MFYKLDVKEVLFAKITRQGICIVLGDINAVSSCERSGYEIIGSPNLGADLSGENSLILWNFAVLKIEDFWLLVSALQPVLLNIV